MVTDPPAASVARHGLSSLGYLAGFLAGRIGQITAHAVVARALGAEGFGLYALGWITLQLGQALGHLGLSEGVVRYLPRYRGRDPAQVRSILWRALGLSGLAGCMLAALLMLSADLLALRIFAEPRLADVLVAFAPGLAVAPLMQVAAAATRATTIMRHSIFTVEFGLPVMLLLAVCGAWFAGASTVAMAHLTSAAFVAIAAAATAQVWWLYRLDVAPTRAAPLRPARVADGLVRFSLAALPMTLTLLLILWTDRLFVGAFRPAAEVGAYHAASQLSMLLVVVFQPLNAVLAPLAATAAWEARREDLKRAYHDVYRWALYVAAPAAALALAFADLILVAIFGPEFALAALPARILIVGQLMYLIGGASGALLVMTGRERLWLAHASGAVVVNLALNAALVPRYGMIGAAIATAVAIAVLQGGGCVIVRRIVGVWPLTRPVAAALAAGALVMTLGEIAVHTAIAGPAGWLRALPPFAGILASLLVLIGTKAHRDDVEILRDLVPRRRDDARGPKRTSDTR